LNPRRNTYFAIDYIEQVASLKLLRTMANEGKEVTIYDLARELDISAATVSRGLQNSPTVNPKTRKRIHDLAQSMGYRSNHFARNLRHQRTYTIGVIIPRLNSYFMSAVISGMENIASKAGFNLIISQSSESAKKEMANVATMFASRVDGLLVSSVYNIDDSHHFDMFLKKKIPVIFFDGVIDDDQYIRVIVDNQRAAKEATRHLIAQGCKRIVHITAKSGRNVYADRLMGYKAALEQAGIPFSEELVIRNNLNYEAGIEAAALIRQIEPMPDGVFVANDNCAVSCMSVLKEAGIRIPQEIAFVGFNNDPVARVVEPNLTTINYPGYEMGEIAMRHLISDLDNRAAATVLNTITLRAELIVRASSLKKE
jgi:LacI family transcriptional regulator